MAAGGAENSVDFVTAIVTGQERMSVDFVDERMITRVCVYDDKKRSESFVH